MKHASGSKQAPHFAKRNLLIGSGLLVSMLGMRGFALAGIAPEDGSIPQPQTPGDEAFIERAFEMRRKAVDLGDQAYGAVIVAEGRIVGQSWSRVVLDSDPTAHAEMAAIRDAARRLQSRDLGKAVMYSSSKPCPMCEAAAYWAGIGKLVYGRDATHGGAPSLCR